MTEAEWWMSTDSIDLLEFLQDKGSDRKFHLLGCAFSRSAPEPIADDSLRALEAVELYADGLSTLDELTTKAFLVAWRAFCAGSGSFAMCCLTAGSLAFKACREALRERFQKEISSQSWRFWDWGKQRRRRAFYAALVREVFGPLPFRTVAFSQEWRTDTAVTLAKQM